MERAALRAHSAPACRSPRLRRQAVRGRPRRVAQVGLGPAASRAARRCEVPRASGASLASVTRVHECNGHGAPSEAQQGRERGVGRAWPGRKPGGRTREKGDEQTRTAVRGFAGLCLATRPRRHNGIVAPGDPSARAAGLRLPAGPPSPPPASVRVGAATTSARAPVASPPRCAADRRASRSSTHTVAGRRARATPRYTGRCTGRPRDSRPCSRACLSAPVRRRDRRPTAATHGAAASAR